MKNHRDEAASNSLRSIYWGIILLMVTAIIVFLANKSFSQTSFNNDQHLLQVNNTENLFSKVNILPYGEKVFLKWTINGLKNDCLFAVQRSENGTDFKTIGVKKGFGTQHEIELLYCYIDEDVPKKDIWYRIGQVNENGEIMYSDVYKINTKQSNKKQDYSMAIN